jgi:hypothetical protein
MARTGFGVLGGGRGGKLMTGLEIRILGFFLKIGDWNLWKKEVTDVTRQR